MMLVLLMIIVSVRTVHLARKVPVTPGLPVNSVHVLAHPRGLHAATVAAFAPARQCVSAVTQYADESGRRYCKENLRDHAFSKLNRRDLKSRSRLWAQFRERRASEQIKTAELVKYRPLIFSG
jgi:hypothetical protein